MAFYVKRRLGRHCRRATSAYSRWRPQGLLGHAVALRRQQHGSAAPADRNGTELKPFSREIMEGGYRAAFSLSAEDAEKKLDFRKIYCK
ncbi:MULTISPECIES: hypothetical protein [Bradyrhizobium]|uniref:hypothetical protein n=1 Tax=Bradyrhizobium TaxID=374 RepID=UPI000A85A602|nr:MULTISPECIES: hypothetical protein [Bradyrhizobium]